jgi:hypothetical protein
MIENDWRAAAAQSLFETLEPSCKQWAARSHAPLEDIRQDLYVFCLELTRGETNYSNAAGSATSYVAGRMWGRTKRYLEYRVEVESAIPERAPAECLQAAQCCGLDALIEAIEDRADREGNLAAAIREHCRANRHLSNLELLRQVGWSRGRAADEVGLSKSTLRSRDRRARYRRDGGGS